MRLSFTGKNGRLYVAAYLNNRSLPVIVNSKSIDIRRGYRHGLSNIKLMEKIY